MDKGFGGETNHGELIDEGRVCTGIKGRTCGGWCGVRGLGRTRRPKSLSHLTVKTLHHRRPSVFCAAVQYLARGSCRGKD